VVWAFEVNIQDANSRKIIMMFFLGLINLFIMIVFKKVNWRVGINGYWKSEINKNKRIYLFSFIKLLNNKF
jgi:hypothetical protein